MVESRVCCPHVDHFSFLALTTLMKDKVITPAPPSVLTATTTTANEDSFTSTGHELTGLVANIALTVSPFFRKIQSWKQSDPTSYSRASQHSLAVCALQTLLREVHDVQESRSQAMRG